MLRRINKMKTPTLIVLILKKKVGDCLHGYNNTAKSKQPGMQLLDPFNGSQKHSAFFHHQKVAFDL